jgi:hypothetical protein
LLSTFGPVGATKEKSASSSASQLWPTIDDLLGSCKQEEYRSHYEQNNRNQVQLFKSMRANLPDSPDRNAYKKHQPKSD